MGIFSKLKQLIDLNASIKSKQQEVEALDAKKNEQSITLENINRGIREGRVASDFKEGSYRSFITCSSYHFNLFLQFRKNLLCAKAFSQNFNIILCNFLNFIKNRG